MSKPSGARLLLVSALLLPAVCRAQSDISLPDAPEAAVLKASAEDRPAFSAQAQPANLSAPENNAIESDSLAGYGEDWQFAPQGIAEGGDRPVLYASEAEGVRVNLDSLLAAMDRPEAALEGGVSAGAGPATEHFHWKGLLWESFGFFGVENSFRLMTDPYFRHLTADKPFWHDYLASVKQWNWRRWDDGDDFLVAYIGHPLQGSVTEFIEIQNDPKARNLRISDGKPYWRNRFGGAFLWATAYSFDQKLGPLGETALGNEGGYTYVIGCPYPCKTYIPGVSKVTNNTGIVKLVTTPVIGTLWTMTEDFFDRYLSDRIEERYPGRLFPKIFRGAINPSRSMANFLRWRAPWYRDFQQGGNYKLTPTVHFLPGDDDVILAAPKYELFPHYSVISLPVNTAACSHCRQLISGYGLGFAKRLATYADWDSDVNYQPNASPLPSDRAGGNILSGTFGLRSGYTAKSYSLKAFLRPGFLSYSSAYEVSPSKTDPTPEIGRITHFVAALGFDADYVVSRHLAIRAVVGNTAVRYRSAQRDASGFGSYPYLTWIAKQNFITNENWSYQTGAVIRF